jgi:hypothetical protein
MISIIRRKACVHHGKAGQGPGSLTTGGKAQNVTANFLRKGVFSAMKWIASATALFLRYGRKNKTRGGL